GGSAVPVRRRPGSPGYPRGESLLAAPGPAAITGAAEAGSCPRADPAKRVQPPVPPLTFPITSVGGLGGRRGPLHARTVPGPAGRGERARPVHPPGQPPAMPALTGPLTPPYYMAEVEAEVALPHRQAQRLAQAGSAVPPP